MLRSILKSRSFSAWSWPSSIKPTTPAFVVTPANGFLPLQDPITDLPSQYKELNSLLDKMSLELPDGSAGLLAKGLFGEAVKKELPLYDVSKIDNQALLMALFRDYTFAASAYLLEPCDIMNKTKGTYGLGRPVLPKNIAIPLEINAKPFMEYAQSYALYNYKRIDPKLPLDYDNLALVRKFSGMASESGFILVHVAMVRHTGKFVEAVNNALIAISQKDRTGFDKAMTQVVSVMETINGVMEEMWAKSLPEDYMKFRAFIMGTKDQTEMFPNGVIYEGVDKNPRSYRGESGANDSIIPTCDNLLQITKKLPTNELTDILKDFRSYRPADHNRWVSFVESASNELGVEKFAQADKKSLVLFIKLLDQVRDFRNRHWSFAKEYIIKRTAYPKATGGSPMATWLPNQLTVILDAIEEQSRLLEQKFGKSEGIEMLVERARAQKRVLVKDVQVFKEKFSKGE